MQLIQYLRNLDITLVDVGSGNGLSGIVLSLLGVKNVVLVESDRAFSSLDKLFLVTTGIKVQEKYLIHKGINYQTELDIIKNKWKFDIQIHNNMTLQEGKILEISKLKKIL